MSKVSWTALAFVALLIGCAPIFGVSMWASSQFTTFGNIDEFRLTEEHSNFRFSTNGCSGHWVAKKTYFTAEPRSFVWDRVYEAWEPLPGEANLYYEEASYAEKRLNAVQVKSRVAYDTYPHLYSVRVTNEVVLQLPKQFCG